MGVAVFISFATVSSLKSGILIDGFRNSELSLHVCKRCVGMRIRMIQIITKLTIANFEHKTKEMVICYTSSATHGCYKPPQKLLTNCCHQASKIRQPQSYTSDQPLYSLTPQFKATL